MPRHGEMTGIVLECTSETSDLVAYIVAIPLHFASYGIPDCTYYLPTPSPLCGKGSSHSKPLLVASILHGQMVMFITASHVVFASDLLTGPRSETVQFHIVVAIDTRYTT